MSTSSKFTLPQWRAAVEGAARELATCALSLPGASVGDPVDLSRAMTMIGAHIPLVGGGQAFDLALVSSPAGCQALSRAILYMSEGAPLRDAEMADAVGEIVNQLGGTVKRRLPGGAELVLGLPLFIHGYIEPTDRLTVIAFPTSFGPIETIVLIAGQRE
jgi:hypothetical protein